MPAQLHHGGEVVDGHHGEIDFQLDPVDEQDGSRLLGEFLQATRRNPRREQHEAVDLAEQVECGGEFVGRVTGVVGDEHAVSVGGGAWCICLTTSKKYAFARSGRITPMFLSDPRTSPRAAVLGR